MLSFWDAQFVCPAYVGYSRISAANNVYNYSNKIFAWWFFSLFILPGYPPASLPPFFSRPTSSSTSFPFLAPFGAGKKRSFVWLWQQKKCGGGGGGFGLAQERRKNLLRKKKEIFPVLCKCWPNWGHFLNVLLYSSAWYVHNARIIPSQQKEYLSMITFPAFFGGLWTSVFRLARFLSRLPKIAGTLFGKNVFFPTILLIFSIYRLKLNRPAVAFSWNKSLTLFLFFLDRLSHRFWGTPEVKGSIFGCALSPENPVRSPSVHLMFALRTP